jgi:hypothetical protein
MLLKKINSFGIIIHGFPAAKIQTLTKLSNLASVKRALATNLALTNRLTFIVNP